VWGAGREGGRDHASQGEVVESYTITSSSSPRHMTAATSSPLRMAVNIASDSELNLSRCTPYARVVRCGGGGGERAVRLGLGLLGRSLAQVAVGRPAAVGLAKGGGGGHDRAGHPEGAAADCSGLAAAPLLDGFGAALPGRRAGGGAGAGGGGLRISHLVAGIKTLILGPTLLPILADFGA